jgi:hypothetical protein
MQILEPKESLRRVKLARICLEKARKSNSQTVRSLFGGLALHNIRLAENKLQALITGMRGLVFCCKTEKEKEPINPLLN